jgi:hypothetical protein
MVSKITTKKRGDRKHRQNAIDEDVRRLAEIAVEIGSECGNPQIVGED